MMTDEIASVETAPPETESAATAKPTRRGRTIGVVLFLGLVSALFYTQFSLFVVQPIGAIPEGRTVLVFRGEGMKFVDSADGICLRVQDSVNLICRMMTMAAVVENNKILLRLPYSKALYLLSTDGQEFDR
jgi:hypothetical protein